MFGKIHYLIRTFDKPSQINRILIVYRYNSETRRYLELWLIAELEFLNTPSKLLCCLSRIFLVRIKKRHAELISTPASNKVVTANPVLQDFRDATQNIVSKLMPMRMRIVRNLEVIDINENYCYGRWRCLAMLAGMHKMCLQIYFKTRSQEHPCQFVDTKPINHVGKLFDFSRQSSNLFS